jgi:hypothetical protein
MYRLLQVAEAPAPGWRRPAHHVTDLAGDHVIPVAAGGDEDGPLRRGPGRVRSSRRQVFDTPAPPAGRRSKPPADVKPRRAGGTPGLHVPIYRERGSVALIRRARFCSGLIPGNGRAASPGTPWAQVRRSSYLIILSGDGRKCPVLSGPDVGVGKVLYVVGLTRGCLEGLVRQRRWVRRPLRPPSLHQHNRGDVPGDH